MVIDYACILVVKPYANYVSAYCTCQVSGYYIWGYFIGNNMNAGKINETVDYIP